MENISTVIIKEQQEVIKKFLPIRFILINAVMVFIYVIYVESDLKSFCIFNIAMVEGIIFNNMLYGFSSRDMKTFKNKFNSKYNNKTKIYKNFINNIISPMIILK
ncbi:sensor histidine kinase, partial [Clostridium botulinum]|nr:sensor histidine kinase [Clostridium botulinum]